MHEKKTSHDSRILSNIRPGKVLGHHGIRVFADKKTGGARSSGLSK